MLEPDKNLILAMMQQESGGNPYAISPKGAQGIMQIMPDTARDPGYGVTPLRGWDGVNPATAPVDEQIRFANDYMAAMARQFGGDKEKALAAYNAGPGAVQKYDGVPPYPETKQYVQNVVNTYNQGNNSMPSSDWMSRAIEVNAEGKPSYSSNASPSSGSDWMSRAIELPGDASLPAADHAGNDMGAMSAAVQGVNSAIPFGERIAAGLGALGAYSYDKLSGLDSGTSLSGYYDQARQNQQETEKKHPGAYITGALGGIAATIPSASAKVISGGPAATEGIRGAVNAIPEALSSVGNWIRGGEIANDAGTIAKAGNLAGKAIRSAIVAAPSGALYSYGASKNAIDTPEAAQDAASGAKLAAAVGAAMPVAGAAINSVVKPKVSPEVAVLAERATKDFGINLSLDQVAPTEFRNTVQKVSQGLPGSGVEGFRQAQRAQWTKAVANEIGQNTDNLGPETIKNFLADTSSKFESLVKNTDIKFKSAPLDELQNIVNDARSNITADYANIVKGKAENIVNQLFTAREVPSGIEYTAKQMTGSKLASIRSQLVQSIPGVAGDARSYVSDMVDVIDNIAKNNISADDVQKLNIARRQWRNFKTLEPLLEKSTDGTINPTQLMQRIASSKYIKASRSALGDDNLVDLARIGKKFLGIKGGSDTVPKSIVTYGAGGLTGMLMTNPALALQTATAAGGGLAANRIYQGLINQSPSIVSRAINNSSTNPSLLPIADILSSRAVQSVP